ncbi:MAG: HAD family hydrolase, partial [Candidatus Omnitrophota bacterium]
MKKLLLYDLDGTLVDTRRDIVAAANFALQELGERPLSPEAVEGRVGRGLRELISGILPPGEDPKRIERGMKIYRDHYRAHLLDHAVVYEGVREFLEYFKERSQAVITNKPDPFSEEILRGLGLAHYFFSIVPGDGAFPRKPKPDSILAMMTETGAGRAETIYIGDSE